ncbi:MAG: YggT family protein [Actinomycetota bacterium]
MAEIICLLLLLALILFALRVVISWFPLDPDGGAAVFAGFLYMVTDPVLRPLRRAIPPLRIGGVALDLSVIIVFFAISILRGAIC